MSAGPKLDPGNRSTLQNIDRSAAATQAPDLDAHAVQATADEIRRLSAEIAQLSDRDLARDTYFAEFLQRIVSALAAVAGAVWLVKPGGDPQLNANVNLDPALASGIEMATAHQTLLNQAAAQGEPCAIPPRTATTRGTGANPTDQLVLLAPLQIDGHTVAVIEIFQRSDRGPAAERGYLRFLTRMGIHATDYLKTQQLRSLQDEQAWSQSLERFLLDAHRRLNVRQTASTVVNESRRLLGCDRVSLAIGRGRSCRLVAISGLDSLDRRALQVRLLGRLTRQVLATGEAIWLSNDSQQLPPQIETAWNRYVDIAHVRRCGILPLLAPIEASESDGQPPEPGEVLGALIVEQSTDGSRDSRQTWRATQLATHTSSALANALTHEHLFLLPLWKVLGKFFDALGGRHYPKTLSATILFVLLAVALTTQKTEFMLPVKGKLQPVARRTVFARQDGVIVDVPVEHGQMVKAGDILVNMRNTDLDVEITSLSGKLTATREQILSIQRSLLDNPRLNAEQQNRLSGELLQLKQVAGNLQRQLALVRQKEQQLTVRAARSGQVVTWEVRDELLHRPVRRGQALMAVVDPGGPWELELYVPERHIAHVIRAANKSGRPLPVTFLLASHADQSFTGEVLEIDRATVARDEQGQSVRVRVGIDKKALPELRSDTTVVAKIGCGRGTLGYAWFHDLIDTVRSHVLFGR